MLVSYVLYRFQDNITVIQRSGRSESGSWKKGRSDSPRFGCLLRCVVIVCYTHISAGIQVRLAKCPVQTTSVVLAIRHTTGAESPSTPSPFSYTGNMNYFQMHLSKFVPTYKSPPTLNTDVDVVYYYRYGN